MRLLRYSLRSVFARSSTSFAAVLGIAALVFTLAGTLMLLAGVHKALDEKGSPNVAVVLSSGSTSESESNWGLPMAQTILAEQGIQDPAAHVEELVTLLDLPRPNGSHVTTAIRGVGPGGEKFRKRFHLVEGRMITPGAAEIVLGLRMKSRLGLQLGSDIEFKKNLRAKVVGFFQDGDSFYESEVWVDRDFLQLAFGRQGFISSMRVRFASPDRVLALQNALEHDRRYGLRVYPEPEFLKKQGVVAAGLITGLGIGMSLLIGLGASLGVAMTMFGTVSQRRREIGVLRALGFTRSQILSAFLVEAIAFGVAAASLGCLVAVVGLRSIDFSLSGGAGEEVSFKFDPGLQPLLIAALIALAISVFSGMLPALRASRIPPTAALRA